MRDLRYGLLLAGMVPVLFLTGCGKKGGSTGQATAPDEKKEVQASVSAASSAAAEDPEEKYKVAYVRSAQAFSRNDLEGAIKYLDVADQAKPNQANNANLRGAIYTRQRDWVKAEAAFRDSLRLQPDMPMAQFNLGEVLFLNNKYAEARERFQIFINSQPKNDLGMYKIYLCDLLGGNQAKANEFLSHCQSRRSVCQTGQGSRNGIRGFGVSYLSAGRQCDFCRFFGGKGLSNRGAGPSDPGG
ncbi:MAG: hypothetical protein EBT57_00215 [Verrucomicrobia bacterium]|nr:hypothetical protein [Verrucomicrobiota bacterium]